MHVILEPEIWRQFGLHSKILPQKSNRVLGAQEVGKTKKRDPIPSKFWFSIGTNMSYYSIIILKKTNIVRIYYHILSKEDYKLLLLNFLKTTLKNIPVFVS